VNARTAARVFVYQHTRAAHTNILSPNWAQETASFRTRKFYSVNAAGGDVRGRNKLDIFNAQVTTYFYGPARS
jgi:hypothetical protein